MSFLRRTLAFADILFLGLWKALCKLINKWTTNLAAKVKTLLKKPQKLSFTTEILHRGMQLVSHDFSF